MIEKKYYTVSSIASDGSIQRQDIQASSAEEATRLSGKPLSRIESVSASVWRNFLHQLQNPAPSLEHQSALLSNFSSMLISGAPPGVAFNTVLTRDRQLGKKSEAASKIPLVSGKLKLLQFDQQIVMMAEIGESAGDLGGTLSTAVDDLIERKKTQSEFKKALAVPVLMLVFGLGAMIITPWFAKEPLDKITAIRGLKFEPNVLTDMMNGIYWITANAWWALLAGIATLFIYRRPLWQLIRTRPPFTRINDVIKIQRSLLFLMSLRTLLRANIPVSQAVRQIRDSNTGETRDALDRMVTHFKGGGQLSTSLRAEDWSELLIDGLSGFDNILRDSRDVVLNRLIQLHKERVKTVNGKLIALIATTGTLMGLLSVFMIFGGMTFPLMGIQTGARF